MKTIEKILAEYKIRFKETEEIDEETYPFDPAYYDGCGEKTSMIMPHLIDTNYGRVFSDGVWATAKITEKPAKWVVKKDEKHPMWKKFKEWQCEIHGMVGFDYHFYNKAHAFNDDLLYFKDHQYLTLDQWAELFLDEPKEGDWCLFWDADESDLEKDDFVSVPFVIAPFFGKKENLFVDIHNEYWTNCQKLSPELSEMIEKGINQIKGRG